MEPMIDPQELQALWVMQQLRLGPDASEWDALWAVLDRIGPNDRRLIGPLCGALHDRSPWVTLFAARALIRIGGDLEAAIPDIASLVRRPDARVQYFRGETAKDTAIEILRRHGRQSPIVAREALLSALLGGRTHAGAMLRAFRALAGVSGGYFRAAKLIWDAESASRAP